MIPYLNPDLQKKKDLLNIGFRKMTFIDRTLGNYLHLGSSTLLSLGNLWRKQTSSRLPVHHVWSASSAHPRSSSTGILCLTLASCGSLPMC